MPRRKVSNPLALAVLACLAERPMHPYEMSTTMRERGKHESIKLNYGSLYSVVESLHKHGLIAPRETVKDGRRPERTVYEITPAGRLEFVDWLGELIGTPTKEYPAFEAGLSMIGGLPPDAAVTLLQQRAAVLRSQLQGGLEMQRYAANLGVPKLFLIEADYRRGQIQAEIDFVDQLARSIADSSLDGVDYWRESQRQYAAGEEVTPFRLPEQEAGRPR